MTISNGKSLAQMLEQRTGQSGFVINSDSEAFLLNEMVSNALLGRSELIKKFLDPRRDIDDECGYPKTNELNAAEYRFMYDRNPIAARLVELWPMECWMLNPDIVEDDDPAVLTAFEEAWADLGKNLMGESWFEDEESNPIWEHLQRLDILSGIGHYGVMLIGIDDGKELSEPAEGIITDGPNTGKMSRTGTNVEREIIYLRCFDESIADITQWDTDENSPRFGQPTMYNLTFNNPRDRNQTGVGPPMTTKQVHWTRLIHLAEIANSTSPIIGTPRQRPSWNRLYDLRKLFGGSAEMYWRGAFPGLSIETHPQLGGDVKINQDDVRNQMENYMNSLQRYLAIMGVSAKSLAPQVVDPTPQINIQIEAICIKEGIPKRIFVGSERGELASSQDTGAWNGRVMGRCKKHLSPNAIAPFVNRCIMLGCLPVPERYKTVWPDLDQLTEKEAAEIAVRRTEAMAKYVQGNIESSLMVPMDFLTRVMGLTENEAEAVLEAAMEMAEEEEKEKEEARARGEALLLEQQQQQEDGNGLPPNQNPNQPPQPGQFGEDVEEEIEA